MSVSTFIQAMPKVETSVLLAGALPVNTLTLIAEQNDIPETVKHYESWAELLQQPDPKRVFDIMRMACSWIIHGDDLVRVIYDFATGLAKQNIRYAEVMIAPSLYTGLTFTYDELAALLNDGRDRAKRAWGIELAWIFTLVRDEPRKADELARWVSTANARRANVIGLGLLGKEDAQPVGQFEHAFKLAAKRDVPCVVSAGDVLGAEGIQQVVDVLSPQRLIDVRGIMDDDAADLRVVLREREVPVVISLHHAVKQGWVEALGEYPLTAMHDDLSVVLGAGMPTFDGATLNDEYQAAADLLSVDAVEQLAFNAVRATFLSAEDKRGMLDLFAQEYAQLRAEHIETETTEEA